MILAQLSELGWVADFDISGRDVTIRWQDRGFDRAFDEMKSTEEPFSFKDRDRVLFVALMWQAEGLRVVGDFIVPRVNERERRADELGNGQ